MTTVVFSSDIDRRIKSLTRQCWFNERDDFRQELYLAAWRALEWAQKHQLEAHAATRYTMRSLTNRARNLARKSRRAAYHDKDLGLRGSEWHLHGILHEKANKDPTVAYEQREFMQGLYEAAPKFFVRTISPTSTKGELRRAREAMRSAREAL